MIRLKVLVSVRHEKLLIYIILTNIFIIHIHENWFVMKSVSENNITFDPNRND